MNAAEKKLILACSGIGLSRENIRVIQECASNVDNWQNALEAATLHGVAPLLYINLKKACPDSLPNQVLNQFRATYLSNSTKNLSISAALIKILDAFKAKGILAVPFKGPLLAEQVYGDVGLRQFSDLDILIKKSDVIQAKNLLIENGYEVDVTIDPEREKKYLEFENSYSFFHRKAGPSIDLHWEMTGRYLLHPIYMETFEDKLESSDFMGHKVFAAPDDIMLVYLCMHGTSHCWERLEWLVCFSEMARQRNEKNLSDIISLADKMGCKRMLYLGLFLSYDLLDAALPDKLLKNILKDKSVVKSGEKVKQIIFNPRPHTTGDAEWRFSPLHIQIRDTYLDRLRYALYLYTMPTIKEWLKLPLPAWLTPLYRIVRPLRLCKTFLFLKRMEKQQKQGEI